MRLLNMKAKRITTQTTNKGKEAASLIITIATIKGGTGKTTTAAALAQAGAAAGHKILAVDIDPQANLSQVLAADPNQPGSYQLLHEGDIRQLIQHTRQGIDVISGSPDLSVERTTPASGKRLAAALEPIKAEYDLLIIDTPPSIGELTFNGLMAAEGLLIPLEADPASLQGLYQIADIAHQMQRGNPDLRILGSILTRYDKRPRINRQYYKAIAQVGEELGAPLLQAIRPGIAIREAQALQQSIYEYAPASKPAEDYKKLYQLIIQISRTGGNHGR